MGLVVSPALAAGTQRARTSCRGMVEQMSGICTVEEIAIKAKLKNDLIAVNVIQSIPSTEPLQ